MTGAQPSPGIVPVTPTSAIAERFLRTCRDAAASRAVQNLSDGTALTFADLLDRYRVVRGALTAAGIGPGACVVSLVGNRPVFFAIFAACLDVGAALLPLSEATDVEMASLVAGTGAAAVITDRPLPLESVRTE